LQNIHEIDPVNNVPEKFRHFRKKIVIHIQKDKNQISWSQLADLVNTSKLTGVRNLG